MLDGVLTLLTCLNSTLTTITIRDPNTSLLYLLTYGHPGELHTNYLLHKQYF